MDKVDFNIKVAEQCLIRASVDDNSERKIKSVIFAKRAIDNALKNYGVDFDNLNIMQGSPSSLKKKTNRKSKSVGSSTGKLDN